MPRTVSSEQVGIRPQDVQASLQEPASALGDPVGRLDAAVRPHLSHLVHLDTAAAAGAYIWKHMFSHLPMRWVNDDQ